MHGGDVTPDDAARRPEISVVIPTHNRGPRLIATLGCALEQGGVDHEVIVVDDGSTDGTAARLAEIEGLRLRVLRHEVPRGVARARNAGIDAARAPWVAFLDDDDLWSPQKLRVQLRRGREANAGAVYCGAVRTDERGEARELIPMPGPGELWGELHRRNPLPSGPSNVIVRTGILRAVGGFDDDFSFLADWDMWLTLASFVEFAAVPDILVAYVDHEGSMTRSGPRTAGREYRRLVGKHRTPAGLRFEPTRFLRYRAGVHRAENRRVRAGVLHIRCGLYGHPADIVRGTALILGGSAYARLRRRGLVPARLADRRRGPAPPPPPGWLTALQHRLG